MREPCKCWQKEISNQMKGFLEKLENIVGMCVLPTQTINTSSTFVQYQFIVVQCLQKIKICKKLLNTMIVQSLFNREHMMLSNS